MDPSKIEFFHTLNIPTKIARQTIEITKSVKILSEGDVVLESAATICKLLNIVPFSYSIKIRNAYMDGNVLPRSIINMDSKDLLTNFS